MSKKPSKIRVVCTLHCIYLWLCESDGAEKKGPAAPHFLVDLLLSKSAVGREEWGNWKSLPFVQRVFLWEIFYQLCRRFYTTFRAFTALKSSCSLSLLHSFQFTFLNEPRYWLYVQEQDFLTTTYISHTIHNLVVLLLAMAVATKTFCSKTRGEEAFLCPRIWVMNREKVRWNTLVSELKKGRLFYNFCFAEKGFLLSHSDGIISIGKRPLGVAKRKKRNEKFKVDINWDAQNRKKAVCWRPPRRPIQKMRKCYCTLLLSEIDNILDPKQAVSPVRL